MKSGSCCSASGRVEPARASTSPLQAALPAVLAVQPLPRTVTTQRPVCAPWGCWLGLTLAKDHTGRWGTGNSGGVLLGDVSALSPEAGTWQPHQAGGGRRGEQGERDRSESWPQNRAGAAPPGQRPLVHSCSKAAERRDYHLCFTEGELNAETSRTCPSPHITNATRV